MSGPGGFAGGVGGVGGVAARPGRVAIVGTGQVGTTLGMALTGAGLSAGVEEVLLLDRDHETAEASLARGAGHRVAGDVQDALSADTIVLAIPVDEIIAFLERHGLGLGPGSLVIDTGSAKTAVVQAMREAIEVSNGALAVGGHPIAGREVSGARHAESAYPRR